MTRDEKLALSRRLARQWLPKTASGMVKAIAVLVYLLAGIIVHSHQTDALVRMENMEYISPVMIAVTANATKFYYLAGGVFMVCLLLTPLDKRAVTDQLQSIGLTNHAGMTPALLRKRKDPEHPRVTIWVFRNQSIPLSKWEDKQADIETALDVSIIQMRYDRGKTRVLLYTVPAQSDLPEVAEWEDDLLSPESFVLTLGEGMLGPATVNLAHIPHILLGGSTGSGKSVLLKLLLMQCLRKGAQVWISDFKGGVDFPPVWHEKCRMCFDEQDLLDLLTGLVEELERRKVLLKEAGCPNLDLYNKRAAEPLQRWIFACDEVAEVLDRTGLTKEQKEHLAKIESKLSMIARQGRAFGIHMILATQRPDASILPGQIKNNMDCRICGRADNVLSQIILDSTAAADQIPKHARGRFLMQDGTMFQAYWFDENRL